MERLLTGDASTRQQVWHLAQQWAQLALPTDQLTYPDFIRIVSQVQQATQQIDQTRHILMAVLVQARRLGKSSEWAENEVRFEVLALAVIQRAELVRLQLEQGAVIDDQALDLYNDRIHRFAPLP